jgi:hypothetical protein
VSGQPEIGPASVVLLQEHCTLTPNVKAAHDFKVSIFRDTLSGIGGCPYEVRKRFPRCGEQSVLHRGVVIERIVP